MTDALGLTLDRLPVGQRARITAVEWPLLDADEGRRLRALGIDVGAAVAVAHRGVFGGSDPLAVTVGRMTVALRRSHAKVMRVEAIAA
jgi:ferrous iron transport protein A